MSNLSRLFEGVLPLLAVLLLVLGLRRLPPAGRLMRLVGGLFVALFGVASLGGAGAIPNPGDAMAVLVVLGMGLALVCVVLGKTHLS